MWEAGGAKNRSGDQGTGRGAPSGSAAGGINGCGMRTGFRRCIGFSCFPPRERTRSG